MVESEVIENRLFEDLPRDLEILEAFDPELVNIILGAMDNHLEERYKDVEI